MTDQTGGKVSIFSRLLRLASVMGLLVALLFGLLSFGPFVAPDIWVADNMSFFLPQLIGGGFAAVFLAAICIRLAGRPRPGKQLRRLFLFTGLVLSVALGLALYHTYRVVAPGLAGASVPATKNLRIVSINLETRYLGDPDFMAYLESLKPDILVFQETEWPYQMRHRKRQGDDTPLIGLGPYFENFLIGDLGSMIAFSRYPVKSSTVIPVEGACGPRRYGNREIFSAIIDVDGSPLNFIAVHPDSPRSPCRWQSRQDYFAALAGVIDALPASEPAIMIGDWNTSPLSNHFENLLQQAGMRVRFPAVVPVITRYFYDYRFRWILGSAVDHAAVSDKVTIRNVAIGGDVGSDHVPLIVDIAIP
ncbi:Uncharacterized protein conserved in bacteria [Pannonibacter phragmitetus]|uniref:Uncharacterized protein conserved in bacteria n=1 Tax=Pannonibacter phragmitetus TaxID=121719 RepID=A0A378ZYT1_9HYPH|nr:endonuclease/exonuclease/phosphatase family protein [Pannonibacter phragmitetus]SUB01999.1 Uncharacterized protein conserved in bacteria [Pannonibacter phragmitetus]